jgi:hypothetical protein
MKTITRYIKDYLSNTDKHIFISVLFFTALLVFCNYYFDAGQLIGKNNSYWFKLFCWYVVFAAAFIIPYFITALKRKVNYFFHFQFTLLLLIAPLIFSWKITANVSFPFSDVLTDYWRQVIYWPVLSLIISSILYFNFKLYNKNEPFYGLAAGKTNLKPYFLIFLCMLPLVALAATQNDFQSVYPKLKSLDDNIASISWWKILLYELSYGTDFLTIELFFRGFLVLAFAKWAGKDAILPMACFYCTIHFGKPLAECISSYFGGLLLGVIVYNTRSIWGGLLVHLGIAWLMEAAGYVANNFN